MTQRRLIIAITALLFACGEETPTAPVDGEQFDGLPVAAEEDMGETFTFEVTIYNLTEGQPFTPPVLASHSAAIRVWRNREAASEGVKEIAENGNTGPLAESLGESDAVGEVVLGSGPIFPGESQTIQVTGSRRMNKVSFVAMLICTNDGFMGLDSFQFPRRVGESRTRFVRGKDAGTEMNTENFSDMVPPCPAITGVETDEMGTGASNPDLAQNDVIRPHPNVRGVEDLLRSLHRWRGPVGKVVVERIE